MISREKKLSVQRQCKLLEVSRATFYYTPHFRDETLLINRIAELYEACPMYGYRRIHALISQEQRVNRKKIARLMRELHLRAIYPGPKTTVRGRESTVFPNRLKQTKITDVFQGYQVDITYLRTIHGFLYLVALLDIYSRYIVSWRISNSLETGACLDVVEDALAFYPKPDLLHSDQGVQFTSKDWLELLEAHGIEPSHSGAGRSNDNAHIERLWRSLKYEYLFIHGCRSVEEVKKGVGEFICWYNERRPHQALGYKTPREVMQSRAEGLAPLPSSPKPEGIVTVNPRPTKSLILAQ